MTKSRRGARVVRLLPVLDEADVLEENLRWWADAGIPTIAVDCGSRDGSDELLRAAEASGAVLRYERFDTTPPWPDVARRLLELAREHRPDVVVLAGADEFFETEDGRPLGRTLARDAAAGRTRMRFDVMEFCWTDADDPAEPSVTARMRHYRHNSAVSSFRAYKLDDTLDLSNPRAMRSERPQRSSSQRFVNRHYPIRSEAQARARLQADRLQPFFVGSIAAPLARVVEEPGELHLPAKWFNRREARTWNRRDAASVALLRRTAAELAEARGGSLKLRRRYGELLLENERLKAAQGAAAAPVAASAAWYDEMYELGRDVYDVDPEESVYLRTWEEIVRRVPPEADVLEVGCGSGQLAALLLERGLAGYVGFDFSTTAIELARGRRPDADFRVEDARTTELVAGNGYDTVVCTEVLEHVDDDLGLLRRLRPGVRVLATVPSFDSASHLRHFGDTGEVAARYGGVIEGLEVDAIELDHGTVLFLLDGCAAGG